MRPIDAFDFCPRCGAARPEKRNHALACGACGFLFHFNPAVAAGAFLLGLDNRMLFIRRARDPAQGRLAVPGGFIDIGETAEDGLRREIREEVNLAPGALRYLCTQVNDYVYRDINYPVLDLYFVGRVESTEGLAALDGVASVCWLDPREVAPEEIAFQSLRAALGVAVASLDSGELIP